MKGGIQVSQEVRDWDPIGDTSNRIFISLHKPKDAEVQKRSGAVCPQQDPSHLLDTCGWKGLWQNVKNEGKTLQQWLCSDWNKLSFMWSCSIRSSRLLGPFGGWWPLPSTSRHQVCARFLSIRLLCNRCGLVSPRVVKGILYACTAAELCEQTRRKAEHGTILGLALTPRISDLSHIDTLTPLGTVDRAAMSTKAAQHCGSSESTA